MPEWLSTVKACVTPCKSNTYNASKKKSGYNIISHFIVHIVHSFQKSKQPTALTRRLSIKMSLTSFPSICTIGHKNIGTAYKLYQLVIYSTKQMKRRSKPFLQILIGFGRLQHLKGFFFIRTMQVQQHHFKFEILVLYLSIRSQNVWCLISFCEGVKWCF